MRGEKNGDDFRRGGSKVGSDDWTWSHVIISTAFSLFIALIILLNDCINDGDDFPQSKKQVCFCAGQSRVHSGRTCCRQKERMRETVSLDEISREITINFLLCNGKKGARIRKCSWWGSRWFSESENASRWCFRSFKRFESERMNEWMPLLSSG